MWLGSHYGGSDFALSHGEAWTKQVGPFFLRVNGGREPEALWREAQERARVLRAAWPFAWAEDPAPARGALRGRIVLRDAFEPAAAARRLRVGLVRPGADWQKDGLGYQFWTAAEPDGSFEPGDVVKLLAYSGDFDVVLGSRTNTELIWTGANMGWFMKWGNWAVAKYMEFLFNTTTLTDVGCTMRLVSRDVLTRVQPFFSIGGSHFGPEMMMLCIWIRANVIEIPLNYKPRVGESMVTGDRWKAFLLGLQMIGLITRFRLRTAAGRGPRLSRGGFHNRRRKAVTVVYES